jgi:hypothetical protein
MRLPWLDFLVALAAAIPRSPVSAAAISLDRVTKPQDTFHIARSAHVERELVPSPTPSTTTPQLPASPEEKKLFVEAADARTRLENWVLEDYVLVPTVEGDLFSLDRHSGAMRWVLEGGAAVQAEVHISDLAGNATNETSIGGHEQMPKWIVQPVDGGQLYLFDREFGVLVTPISSRGLIMLATPVDG